MKSIVLATLFASSVLLATACSSSSSDATPVGTVHVGAYTIDISQENAGVTPGGTSRFVLKPSAGGKPTGITGWIGVQSGEGSVKKDAVYDPNDGDFDDDVVAPNPIPAGALFWFEVATNEQRDVGSIAWTK